MASVLVEKDERLGEGVVAVTLNRPEVRNAFDSATIEGLRSAFERQINPDPAVRAVCLRGAGGSFCAGADLRWMRSMVDFTPAQNLADADALYAMFAAVRACPVPVIGRVHGHAMGGALGLVAACDVVVAEGKTRFCFSEVRLGIAPAVISPFVLETASPAFAARWMLTGDAFGPAEALAGGLAAEVADGIEDLDARVARILASVLQAGSEAVRATKALLRASGGLSDRTELRAFAAQTIAERRASAEGQEGMRAFLEKRRPSWLPSPALSARNGRSP